MARGLYPSTRKDIQEAQEIIEMVLRPKVDFVETWQDEVAGIDPAIWTIAVTGTGAVVHDATETGYLKALLTGTGNGDTARLTSDQRWVCAPDLYGKNTIRRRLTMEFEAKFATVASIDNTAFFMGLASATNATEASNNIAGFILDASDELNSVTDDGARTAKAIGDPTLTNWHKYSIDVYEEVISFYVDEVEVSRHSTAAAEDLPDTTMYQNYYLPQEAAANGGELHVGIIKVWPADNPIRF